LIPLPHTTTSTARFGSPLSQARGAVILVHGRGSSPHDIAGLADVIPGAGLAFLAPAATGGTWYPQRFLAPLERNEPWLSSALNVIDRLVAEVLAAGIAAERIGLAGFSQGACLVLEYASRHPRRYGFVAGLSGALIGPPDTPRPASDLQRTPVLLGCAELDAHIPVDYVERSAEILSRLNADVTKQIFPGAAHAVFPAETEWLNQHPLV
jgi:phospholipase/carboxylesterase